MKPSSYVKWSNNISRKLFNDLMESHRSYDYNIHLLNDFRAYWKKMQKEKGKTLCPDHLSTTEWDKYFFEFMDNKKG